MDIDNLISERDCGFTRFVYLSNYPEFTMDNILIRLGLSNNHNNLIEINKQDAIDILTLLLWKDMAYFTEIMEKEKAHNYSQVVINYYSYSDSKYYTNGLWKNYYESQTPASWYGMTNSNFDGGIIIISSDKVICIWIEDED